MSRLAFCFITITILLYGQGLFAQGLCEEWLGKLASRQGRVESQIAPHSSWKTAALKETYCPKDQIRTWERSRALVALNNETYLTLDQKTTLHFTGTEEKEPSWIDVINGIIYFRSRIRRILEIKTPFVNAIIRGTEFLVAVDDDQTEIIVFEGVVDATNQYGSLTLNKGQGAVAKRGQAPTLKIRVKPKDAVHWTLYYPPLVNDRSLPSTPAAIDIQKSIDSYKNNNLAGAFAILDDITPEKRGVEFYTLRAGLLLVVGRVDEAQPDLSKALSINPNHSPAIALQSIIAVAQNNNDNALELAQQSVKADPQSASAHIALSYANQAKFNLEESQKNLERAVELAPDDALAWARLAELQLSFGDLDAALESAQKATALDPDLARTQSVLGFAELTQIDIDEAKAKFEKAIQLDPAAPLPRLGLGLAKIRQGDVEEGTEEIQIAASLDPDNSLIRSYLGKAFYELKDDKWSEKELTIAKELDPNDPTPWFYDAIRKQTINRPVEALHDMQKAIELNDNRAVYRSRLLLDDDLAARSAALGRIYNDLGFQQRGLLEGWKSVDQSAINYSAHRLLADNYAVLRRHEIARVSELLQSQLLQPINITPVQPQLAESNLFILDGLGPASLSFNEFNPLFSRNRLALQASGVYGSNNTWGNEVTQSGIWNRFAYSLGQFHYETNGFRENNDIETDLYNAFFQVALSPSLSVQAEVRYRDIESGDLRLRFTNQFDKENRRTTRDELYRFGVHYRFDRANSVLSSIYYNTRDGKTTDLDVTPGVFSDSLVNTDDLESYTGELKYIHQSDSFDLSVGIGYFDQDRTDKSFRNRISQIPFFFPSTNTLTAVDSNTQHFNSYFYLTPKVIDTLSWTVGLSFDSFKQTNGNFRYDRLNPKLGIIWTPIPSTTIRLAAFKAMKRPLLGNATIERTQIAGFSQFFDDLDGTRTKRIGVGLDHKFSNRILTGLEASWRSLKIPRIGATEMERQREQMHRAYFNWTPSDQLALSFSYFFERFHISPPNRNDDTNPRKITTHRFPLIVSLFHPRGIFAKLGASFNNQTASFTETSNKQGNTQNFWIVDTTIGYRIPNRWGIVSIGAKNLLNRKFAHFEDVNFQTDAALIPQFQPERTIFGQFTIAF